jgi:hypothetical protein
MATFAGTTQKCKACDKTVYLVDQLTVDNKFYHKACFRCHHCKGTLKVDTILPLCVCVCVCVYHNYMQKSAQRYRYNIDISSFTGSYIFIVTF